MKFECSNAERACFPIDFMCQQLGVSRSGYYAWKQRPESERDKADRALAEEVTTVRQESRGRYGSQRVHAELRARGRRVSRKRVARLITTVVNPVALRRAWGPPPGALAPLCEARITTVVLMGQQGLAARKKRRFVQTTDSRHAQPVAPNILERDFSPGQPNSTWATDITYVWTRQGWLYLAVVMDLFSRMIVGWAMSERIGTWCSTRSIWPSRADSQREDCCTTRTGAGSHASQDYQKALAARGIQCSMSRKGNCWDNAVAESFFSSLKMELVHDADFATHEQARTALFEYIEVFYNRQRRHSSLGYVSPVDFELAALPQKLAS